MVLGRSISDSYILNFDGTKNSFTDEVTLLGVTTDNKLTFKNNSDELCRKASYKLHALRRMRHYLSKKATLLENAFVNCQFLYAPLIRMFARKSSINKIYKIHFRILQVVYNAHDQSYEELLTVSNDISVY